MVASEIGVKSVSEQDMLLILTKVFGVTMKIEPSLIWVLLWEKMCAMVVLRHALRSINWCQDENRVQV